ncbi:MAG: HAD-IA family hydrolase [Armatimonadota bacterium]|nr:HAD-IA family hydrolase [Armatimonadota bacterium]
MHTGGANSSGHPLDTRGALTRTQPSLRCALFDIDGTLVDTVELIIRALDHTFRKHLGLQISRDELRRTIGLPLYQQVRLFDHLVDFVPDHRAMEADEIAFYESHKHLERIIPEAVEALREVKRAGWRTALVTSKNRQELETFLPRLNANGWVDTVVSASDVERPKPAPDSVLVALERLSVPPDEAVFVGDTVYDIQCARAAGVRVIAVGWGAHLPEMLRAASPDWWVEEPAQLRDLLRSLAQRAETRVAGVRIPAAESPP